jgi:hypothetical protein
MRAIWDRVNVSNEELLREVMGPPPTAEQMESFVRAVEELAIKHEEQL